MKYIRAFVLYDHVDGEWRVHVRRGGTFFSRDRSEAIECAAHSLPEGYTLRLVG